MIRSKSGEKLSFDNIERVVQQLEKDNPITKKEACEILNIRYNTTRLQKIIDDHLETKHFREVRKSQNKGKAATEDEIKSLIDDICLNFTEPLTMRDMGSIMSQFKEKCSGQADNRIVSQLVKSKINA